VVGEVGEVVFVDGGLVFEMEADLDEFMAGGFLGMGGFYHRRRLTVQKGEGRVGRRLAITRGRTPPHTEVCGISSDDEPSSPSELELDATYKSTKEDYMPRLEHMTEVMRKQALFFPCMEFPDNPWTEMRKPLSRCKVALVTSAGLHMRGDKPFVGDHEKRDQSYMVIPSDAKAGDILQSHTSIGFDRTGIYKDINVAFPIDRLRELAERGVIGGLAKNFYSFMGAVTYPNRIIAETGPEAAGLMREEGVDVVLLTPV